MTMLFVEWERPGVWAELGNLKELVTDEPEEKEKPRYVDPRLGF